MFKEIKQRFLKHEKVSIRPGIKMGIYPQQEEVIRNSFMSMLVAIFGAIEYHNPFRKLKWKKMIRQVEKHETLLKKLDQNRFNILLQALRKQLNINGMDDRLIMQAFAFVREASARTIGKRHYDCQLIGSWVMLKGSLAEMETGEGKTLTATLAACTAGLAGIPVHIITVNDYLVERDASLMMPLYDALGLSVGFIKENMTLPERQQAYACDIVYGSNQQIAFDYMRDRLAMGNKIGRMKLQLERLYREDAGQSNLMMRGLCFAIVDEADSVLIDEARTPLIISQEIHGSDSTQLVYRQSLLLARQLKPGEDYQINKRTNEILFTDKGLSDIEKHSKPMGPIWKGKLRREELVHQALMAVHIFKRDRHYLVRDGKIHIIDANTGRLMSDRNWGRGLHQMIETKEGCELSGHKETLAQLTYQRFFRRYLHLAGMTGTAKEVSGELKAVYDLKVVSIPTRKPVQRHWLGLYMYKDVKSKWMAIIKRVNQLHKQGRPVLVGTRSVQESEYISQLLTRVNLKHHVLSAQQDQNEAAIVAEGGKRGCITVATNMAGRGTDIPLHDGVANIGGLHVIATEYNEARRIDRQLYGRCARQGDPGSCEAIVSLDDELLKDHCPVFVRHWLEKKITAKKPARGSVARLALVLSQWRVEKMHRQMRRSVLKTQEKMDKMLAFSGRSE